jgi:hypothetical protein
MSLPMTAGELVRYQSVDEDRYRWLEFEFRAGDIVISTRSKMGATWLQMICALLILGTSDLPRPRISRPRPRLNNAWAPPSSRASIGPIQEPVH